MMNHLRAMINDLSEEIVIGRGLQSKDTLIIDPSNPVIPDMSQMTEVKKVSLIGRRSSELFAVKWPPNMNSLDLSELIVDHRNLTIPSTVRRLTLDRTFANVITSGFELDELSAADCRLIKDISPTLTALNISRSTIDPITLTQLPTTLRRLHVSGQDMLMDEDLMRLPNLIELDCSYCSNVSNCGISKITTLEYLNCSGCPLVSTKGIRPLKRLKVLIFHQCPKISLDVIKTLPYIQRIGTNMRSTSSRLALHDARYLAAIEHRSEGVPHVYTGSIRWTTIIVIVIIIANAICYNYYSLLQSV